MKFLALLLFALIPSLLGIWKGEEAKEKLKQREAFFSLLKEIQFQIENFNRDQREIFFSFENQILKKCGFMDDLIEEINTAPLGALHRSAAAFLPSFAYSKRSLFTILSFTEHFGEQSRDRQLQEIEKTIKILKEEMETDKKETGNKIKMMRISGIAAGLSILILLI